MAVKSERARASEEDYFRQQDAEKLERAREAARREGLKQLLAEKVGATDPEVLELLLEMGLDKETVRVVPLLPLVQVAWADGEISSKEAALVHEAARARQIPGTGPAHELLEGLLRTRPSDAYFEKALVVLRDVLASLPEEERRKGMESFAAAVQAIAVASGGFFGLGKVSPGEREAIQKVAAELEKSHEHAARKVAASV